MLFHFENQNQQTHIKICKFILIWTTYRSKYFGHLLCPSSGRCCLKGILHRSPAGLTLLQHNTTPPPLLGWWYHTHTHTHTHTMITQFSTNNFINMLYVNVDIKPSRFTFVYYFDGLCNISFKEHPLKHVENYTVCTTINVHSYICTWWLCFLQFIISAW